MERSKIPFPPTWWRLVLLSVVLLFSSRTAFAQFAQGPVEVRVPLAPQPVTGSDGLVHVAYELHVTNFYQSTGTLRLKRVTVFADGISLVLAHFTAAQVNSLLAHPTEGVDTLGVPLEAGKRVVLFLWLTLPSGRPRPQMLQHQLAFVTTSGVQQLVDGVRTPLNAMPPVVLGAPLRAGPWLTHEGPGNHLSHHWGSIVTVNGQATIPQRYAIDFFGLTPTGHAVHVARDQLNASTNADWVGFGAEVLAVADGVVRDLRDGEPNHLPLASLPELTDLTVRTLMGNFVVLEIAPHVFVHYAHLQPGSLAVKVGGRVRRGTVLGRLGQSGNANAPHLHLQVSNAATFEESEGLPFVFQTFDRTGSIQIGDVLDQAVKVSLETNFQKPCRQQLPLDGNVIIFK
ncbi:M23 family metallopeptidase [uncultured Hymenobacter sp.]|uniref:M23 family metallopeptidase n=1 Tax=uncultured Hymenobacter sp. TaxID=170016 RepID=UPI0035CC2889